MLKYLLPFLISISAAHAFDPLRDAECQNDYLELFSRPEINVTAVFGYDDDGDKVTGQKDIEHLLGQLTRPCQSWGKKMCGFKIEGSGPYVLTRKIFGPDGLPRLLKITADQPAVSDSDSLNKKSPLQSTRSERLKSIFLQGLAHSELTVYMGHSRDGGGPDFFPPRKKANGHVNYDWYHAHRDNKGDMIQAIQSNPDQARIIALLSCSSLRFFAKGINQSSGATGLIGTTSTYYTNSYDQLEPFFEKIFSYQCIAKLSVPDDSKKSEVRMRGMWKIPEQDRLLTRTESISRTLEALARDLSSSDLSVRAEAHREIKAFDSQSYSEKVWKALKTYEFGIHLKNVLD